jgi:DNA/RNA endonuclease G (NUC1)
VHYAATYHSALQALDVADVFLSYSSQDRPQARRVATLLEDNGWTVWWDRGIEAGAAWEPELEQALARTRAVLVLWSPNSQRSKWVRYEAGIGAEKNALISVLIDSTKVPEEFSDKQAADLTGWDGDPRRAEVQAMLAGLARLVAPSRLAQVRPGYDPRFLGARSPVALPAVTGAAVVLRYLHFTVVMHPGRRLAHYVAYNVDGKELLAVPPEAREWAVDPLIPASLQVSVALTSHSEFHRGHLVSPMTVCWGERDAAVVAARQASFLTNVSPQHEAVNVGSWLLLEQWERAAAKRQGRAVGFSGPIFSNRDEPFRGEMRLEEGVFATDTFRLPRHFWKVVIVRRAKGGLACAAHWVANRKRRGRSSRSAAAEIQRVSLAELESRSGLKFPEALHAAAELKGPAPALP